MEEIIEENKEKHEGIKRDRNLRKEEKRKKKRLSKHEMKDK